MNETQSRVNFNPGSLKLSVAAKQVITRLDESLKLYTDRGKTPDHIYLYAHNFKALNTSLKAASKGRLSLYDNNYKGIRLLSETNA